jgi:hypothetical protein
MSKKSSSFFVRQESGDKSAKGGHQRGLPKFFLRTSVDESHDDDTVVKSDRSSFDTRLPKFFQKKRHVGAALAATEESEESTDTGQCAICLMPSAGEKSRPDACQHVFCWTCIDQWASVSTQCPICKAEFRAIVGQTHTKGVSPKKQRTADDDDFEFVEDEGEEDEVEEGEEDDRWAITLNFGAPREDPVEVPAHFYEQEDAELDD